MRYVLLTFCLTLKKLHLILYCIVLYMLLLCVVIALSQHPRPLEPQGTLQPDIVSLFILKTSYTIVTHLDRRLV